MARPKLNQIAYTTKYVVKHKSWIAYVVHDDEDDWHFYGPEKNLGEQDASLVSIAEIIQMDRSIVDLFEMPRGFEAYRNRKNEEWEIWPIQRKVEH